MKQSRPTLGKETPIVFKVASVPARHKLKEACIIHSLGIFSVAFDHGFPRRPSTSIHPKTFLCVPEASIHPQGFIFPLGREEERGLTRSFGPGCSGYSGHSPAFHSNPPTASELQPPGCVAFAWTRVIRFEKNPTSAHFPRKVTFQPASGTVALRVASQQKRRCAELQSPVPMASAATVAPSHTTA